MKKDIKLCNLRTVINPGTLRPYFSRLGQIPIHQRYKYVHIYDFNEFGLIKAKIESPIPMINKSTIENMFIRSIRKYIENDIEAIRLSLHPISVVPVRVSIYNNDIEPLQQYMLDGFRGVMCINRENIQGGILETGDFKRELIPLEMVISPSLSISPVQILDTYIQESYIDMLFFHLR